MKAFLLGLLTIFWSHLAIGQTLYTFNGGGTSGNWNDPSIWTTDPTGSTSVGARVPDGSYPNVVITNSFTVFVNAPVSTTGLSITVQKGGVLDLNNAAYTTANPAFPSLARLAGQGTLRIAAPYFPAIATNANDFDDANTGTVEYYNWPAGATVLPQPASGQYNNLRLLNTTTTAYAAQLDNSLLTLKGSLTLTRTNTTVTTPLVSFNLGRTASNNRTLAVEGNITVGAGTALGVTAVTGTHVLNVSGSFVNNGTVNLHNGTANDNQVALLNFTGTADANFACNGPTDLSRMQVDKGTDSKVLLNVTSSVNPLNGNGNLRLNQVANGDLLVLKNGITKLGINVYLTKIHNGNPANLSTSTGWYELGSTTSSPTLWINGATVLNDNADLFVVYGIYRITSGKLSSENDGGMVIREDGQVLIEGGTTVVNKFRPSSTDAQHRGSFTMTNGLMQVTGKIVTSTYDDQFSRFALPYPSQAFRMSGGTIEVRNPSGSGDGFFHIGVNPNNAIVSGGTIKLFLPDNTTDCRILTTAPLYNLSISKPVAGGTSKALLSAMTLAFNNATTAIQPLTVLNNFTIDGANPATFDATNQNLTIQGSFIIGTGCTYLPGTNNTIFSGDQNQLLTNNGFIGTTANVGAFNNWTIDKSAGTLVLGGTVPTYTVAAAGTLSLLNGVLNDGGKSIRVLGNMVNSASHTSGGGAGNITMAGNALQTISGNDRGVFGNLTIASNMTVGTTPVVAVVMTANMSVSNTLNFSNKHILAIGANRLSLTNVSASNAITSDNGFDNYNFVQTAGNQSDLGLQKTYGGADNFTFPVGTDAKYAPALIQLQLATTLAKYGQISVSPVNAKNPFTTTTVPNTPANALKYYWKVRSVGFGTIPANAINMSFRLTNTDIVGTRANYIPGYYNPVAWTKPAGAVGTGNPNASITFNNLSQFEGEYTAGETTAFGAVTAFYSRANGTWNTNTTWSTTSNSGGAVPTGTVAGVNFPGPGNPVFIGLASASLFHTVTVNTGNATSNPVVAGATSGSLVIDRGSVLDIGTTTNHNFGALPDAKVGGSGRLRVSSNGSTANFFPGGDFGSFLQENGGTVEYYTTGTTNFTLPTASGTLSLNSYRYLWLNAGAGRTITLPNLNLRVFAQLKAGIPTTYPGIVMISGTANGNLRVDSLLAVQAGALRFANGTARTLTADTDVRIDAGATFDENTTGTAVTNTMTVGGSLTNNGTLDLNIAGSRRTTLTFTGSQDARLTGTATGALTDLYTLTVNKGLGRAATLSLDVAGTLTTPTSNWLTLTNGTLRYAKGSGQLVIHDATTTYLIADNAGLTVDAPGANVTVATNTTTAAADLKLAGEIRVLQGTLSVGTTGNVGNDLEYASAGAPTLRVASGGTLYVNGQVRRTVNNLDGSLRYEQSGGTVTIDGFVASAAQSNERGLFEVQGVGSMFRMSAGTLNLRRSNGRPAFTADLYLDPDSTVVTGGTVLLGHPAATADATVSVNSTVPLYDLQVVSSSSTFKNTGLLTGLNDLSLKGSLTIGTTVGNTNSFFNANGLGLSIDQNLINNNTSTSTDLTNGGFRPTTAAQTTTFTGKGPALQQLTGAASNLTVFGSLVVSNAQANGTLQLGGNARVIGTLTLAKGTLADNGQTITALGDVNNSALHTSTGSGSLTLAGTTNQNIGGNGLGRFGNVALNNAAGATTTATQEITSVLTLTNGVLSIGSNLLLLSNPAAGAVVGTFGTTRFIRTNGIVADQGVRKNYPTGASDFTFPIGAGNKYTPVRMNVTTNTAVGALTVQPIDLAHPSTTDPVARELSFYWKVRGTGFNAPVVTQTFSYTDNDVNGAETSYKLGRFLNGAWAPQGGISTSVVAAGANTLTNAATYFNGDYTGGEPSEFGEVPTFYSRNATAGQAAGAPANWNDPASWTYNADGSDGPLALPTDFPKLANPVVIRPNHVITANGNGRGAANLVLQGTLDLGTNVANNFSTITGSGTLRIGSALFPAGNYSAFVAAGGGTVEYSGAVQLPARDTYNHLTLSGNNTKQLSNLDLTLNGALTIGTGTTVDNPTSQNITLTSNTSGATIRGRFNLNDGALTTGASLTNNGTLVLGAGAVSVGTAFTNGGTLNNGTGAITVGTAFDNSGTYNANVGPGDLTVGTTFTNSNEYYAGLGKLEVSGSFSNSGTFTAASGDVTALSNFSNAGTYSGSGNIVRITGNFDNQNTGSFLADAANMVLRGNITNRGYFDPGTSLVQLLTEANRTVTGNTTFYNLQKLGSGTLAFGPATDVTVANLMTLQNGFILTGTTNKLVLTNTTTQPIIGTSLTSYVAGRLAMKLPNEAAAIRVFPVGAGGRYRPVTIKPQGASVDPVVLVEIFNGEPAGSIDATLANLSTNRYYRIQLLSGTITQPTVQLSFNTDVVDEQVNVPGNLRVARSTGNAGPWSTAGGGGVYSPEAPRGYTISAPTTIDNNSFFAVASTNKVDNPLTGQAPLPVELLQFTATRQGSAVAVAWATASEKNSAYFQVQRSANGRTFTAIERVEAQGTSTSRHDYATRDAQPLGGLSYYRLRQVDRDGAEAYSPIVTVRFEGGQQAPSLVAFPNPASGQGFQLLTSNLGTTGGTVTVFDNVGRAVLTHVAAADAVETTIQPKHPLAAGLYFVTWQTADGRKLTTKVTVE